MRGSKTHICVLKYQKHRLLKFLILLILAIFTLNLFPTALTIEDGINGGEYYFAYGDSITVATGTELRSEGVDCYIFQMRDIYDPKKSADHNLDGGGKNTTWALKNHAIPPLEPNEYYIIMFGVNDFRTLSIPQTVSNLINLHNATLQIGSKPIMCIPTLRQEEETQGDRIRAIEEGFEQFDIPYVKMYDAIDMIPKNGRNDGWNQSNYMDSGHPNFHGHYLMGKFLWNFINHNNYEEIYFPWNDTIKVEVYYNHTIYAKKPVQWNWTDIEILCETNSTIIHWEQGYNNTIHFSGEKGNTYLLYNTHLISPEDQMSIILFLTIGFLLIAASGIIFYLIKYNVIRFKK